ncbi:MAG: hypothetical protein R3C39_13405 [Dehalococcoidia bacterium]
MRAAERSLVLAAGLAAAAELVLFRVAVPVLSHMPGAGLAGVGSMLTAVAECSFKATAVLVLASAALVALRLARSEPAVAVALVAAFGGVTVETLASGGWASLTARAALVSAIGVVIAAAWTRLPLLFGAAHAAAALAVLGGQWPLLVKDAAAVAGSAASTGTTVSTSVGELAFVFAPVLFAVALVRGHSPTRGSWIGGAAAGLFVASLLARRPDYAAIISSWAVGVTLSLPPFIYIVSAACAGLVAIEWLHAPATRPLAAGLVLLAAAALQPAVVHHNLTAVLALVVLAMLPAAETTPLVSRTPSGRERQDWDRRRAAAERPSATAVEMPGDRGLIAGVGGPS